MPLPPRPDGAFLSQPNAMLSIDRDASTPPSEQLAEQLRYEIMSGQRAVGEALPSTRKLGEHLGLSFHTVRKAYQALKDEGLLSARAGSGYAVKARTPLAKRERMERGAGVVHEALVRLLGLGLTGAEVDRLFLEQKALLETDGTARKLVFAAPFREMAAQCAEAVAAALDHPVTPAPADEISRHADADVVFAPFDHVRRVAQRLARAEVVGLQLTLSPEALERVARLLPHETLGLVTGHADAIEPLEEALRRATGFAGPVVAAAAHAAGGAAALAELAGQADWLVYTPASRGPLAAFLEDGASQATPLHFVIEPATLSRLRDAVPL